MVNKTRKFNAILISGLQLLLFWAELIQYLVLTPVSRRTILILSGFFPVGEIYEVPHHEVSFSIPNTHPFRLKYLPKNPGLKIKIWCNNNNNNNDRLVDIVVSMSDYWSWDRGFDPRHFHKF